MKRTFIVMLLAGVALAAGCNSKKNDAEKLAAHPWSLHEVVFDNNEFTETPPANVTIAFDDSTKRISGNGSCNGYFGPYTLGENDAISFGQVASTLMACPNMEFEGKYFAWLRDVDKFEVKDDELRLKATSVGTTLVYKPEFRAAE